MNCVVCDSENWKKKFTRLRTDFVECNNCGLIRMDPIPSLDQISNHYAKKFVAGNYELLRRYEADYETVYRQFLKLTTSYSGNPEGQKLLDIGCFTGRFLDVAKQAGFLTYGVEYQSEAAGIANQKHDRRVHCGQIENYSEAPSSSFDVVTLFGVIEHVTAPDNTVRIISELIKRDGIFVVQTPDTASFPARFLGKWWPGYAPVEHIYYFSSQNIRFLLGKYGFKVVKIVSHWKRLPITYAYNQFQNFGPEFHKLFSNIIPLVPRKILNWKLPFYGGEMLLVAKKLSRPKGCSKFLVNSPET